jgi:uncharacterized protein YjdB
MYQRYCYLSLARQVRIFSGFVSFLFAAVCAFAGFSIQDGLLIDNNGNEFIMRGINYPHVWYATQTPTSIPNIAATGANCVRVVLGSGKQWGPSTAADVAQVIQRCKDNKLVAILEVHDCTGYGDVGGYAPNAAPVSTAVDYWISIQSALTGQENFVIINIANEPLGNGVPASTWVSVHTDAIARLRAAGFTHTLMVDGATWGQDYDQTMLLNASTVFNSDPLKNTIFSVHMYQIYALRSTIQNYLTTFVTAHLPLVVGEFGPQSSQPADVASILDITQVLGLGYMGWSWSGNTGGGTETLDIALNFNPATLSPWGDTLINGVNGIAATSQLSSVFGNVPMLQLSPTVFSFAAPAQTATVNIKTNQSWTVSTSQPWITASPTAGLNNASLAVTAAANPNLGPRSGTVTVAGGTLSRRITVNQIGTGGAGVCSDPVSIPLPFAQNGAGEFCWVTSGNITSINNWSVQSLDINGVSYANQFATAMPPRINGSYYIHYVAGLSYAHFEIAGTAGNSVPATGVSVAPTAFSLNVGAALTLTATVAPSNATNKTVAWNSSNTSVATVNASGVVVGIAQGAAIITATTQDGSYTATAAVSVINVNVPVTGVSLVPVTATIGIGSSTTLTAIGAPANATNKIITWSSSAPSVATVDASGVVKGVALGTTIVTVTTQDGGFTATCIITVVDINVPVTGVSVAPATANVSIGGTTTLAATVAPTNATNKTVTWSSSAPAVATVNASGVVTGVALGSATITAQTQSGGFTAGSVVSVTTTTPTPCTNPTAITLSFAHDGVGEFCWVTSGTVNFINSWNMQKVEINGVDFSNKWASSLPARINGNYYIHYIGAFPWSHLEINGTP